MSYLVSTFISQRTNHRTDEFGGCFENRMRLPRLIIENIRRKTGGNLPILCRINASDEVEGGQSVQDAAAVAAYLEQECGVDALHVTRAVHLHDEFMWAPGVTHGGFNADLVTEIKRAVSVPVIAVGRFTEPQYAELLVKQGRVDLIAFGRQSIADPELPAKARTGHLEELAPCIGCLLGCVPNMFAGRPITCAVNPCVGREAELTPTATAKRVVVVGGGPGGYSILANAQDSTGALGMAGGYAGAVYGGHIQDSNAHQFAYIVGQIAAGGYAGQMEPGDVANLLGDASILGSLVSADAALASLLQTFVPTIRNSSTDCVPCGGAVRAQAASDAAVQRGMAGGYVGHNMGGSIWGLNTDPWKTATEPYAGPTSVCKAERIRSVYGAEYAGGYTGFMEAADTASVGGLNVLNGLISVDNILGALSVVYPTQEHTAVYGPLANLDYQTWNAWVEYVGKHGGYGYELAQTGPVSNQEELDAKLAGFVYGFHVVAGRSQKDTMLANQGGDAGGYVGLMRSGTLTNCMAYDVKLVRALRAAGGFAGGPPAFTFAESRRCGGPINYEGGLNVPLHASPAWPRGLILLF